MKKQRAKDCIQEFHRNGEKTELDQELLRKIAPKSSTTSAAGAQRRARESASRPAASWDAQDIRAQVAKRQAELEAEEKKRKARESSRRSAFQSFIAKEPRPQASKPQPSSHANNQPNSQPNKRVSSSSQASNNKKPSTKKSAGSSYPAYRPSQKVTTGQGPDPRDRVVVITMPSGADVGTVYRALFHAKPGAVYNFEVNRTTARFEFFHEAFASALVERINKEGISYGGVYFRRARIDRAEAEQPDMHFTTRTLVFCASPGSAVAPYCRSHEDIWDLLDHHGLTPRSHGSFGQASHDVTGSMVVVEFMSCREAREVMDRLARVQPDLYVTTLEDGLGPVRPPSATDANNGGGRTGGSGVAGVDPQKYPATAAFDRVVSKVLYVLCGVLGIVAFVTTMKRVNADVRERANKRKKNETPPIE